MAEYISFQPSDYYNTKLYTGTGSSNAITSVGFQPDFTWIKNRDTSDFHVLTDAVRLATKYIQSNDGADEVTNAESLKSFDSDGFTVGTQNEVNTNTEDFVSWNWKANGAGSLNEVGTIDSTVSVNTTAGFSIVKYVGTGVNATIGHGLGVAPKFVMVKRLDGGSVSWSCFHIDLAAGYVMNLDSTGASNSVATAFQSTNPASTVFSVGTSYFTNDNTQNFIAYCFADITGYSKIGTYTANSNADGPFIYTGFSPAFIMIKRTDVAKNWYILDTKRQGYNPQNNELAANTTSATDVISRLDILSNGFKLTSSSPSVNVGTFIYIAFAEFPTVSSNDIPATAR